LWKEKYLPLLETPSYEVDPSPFLRPYFERAGVHPESLSAAGFELLIGSWLVDLISIDELPEVYRGDDSWLIESGLFAAIKDGTVTFQPVV
jgi:hypothetical protein